MVVRESVLRLGEGGRLVGVLTEPPAPRDRSRMLLLLNSGAMHRVGSCRMTVRIARAVAERAGIATLRFDFSGIGDSPARRGTARFEESAEADLREVMDQLQRERGVLDFALYGLCSGADIATRVAAADARVSHVAQVDGHCFPTWRSRARYYLGRARSPVQLKAFLQRLLGLRRPVRDGAVAAGIAPGYFEVPVAPDEVGQREVSERLQRMMRRGVRLMCFFTGREPWFNHPGQFEECFRGVPFGDRLRVVHLPDSLHILSDPPGQAAVVNGIADWLATDPLLQPAASGEAAAQRLY